MKKEELKFCPKCHFEILDENDFVFYCLNPRCGFTCDINENLNDHFSYNFNCLDKLREKGVNK